MIDDLDEKIATIKSGRASTDIFNDIEINAYGEKHPFADLCQTIVKGTNALLVKVFDDAVKEEVIKALQRTDLDLSVT